MLRVYDFIIVEINKHAFIVFLRKPKKFPYIFKKLQIEEDICLQVMSIVVLCIVVEL